jgi:hypothetical protein
MQDIEDTLTNKAKKSEKRGLLLQKIQDQDFEFVYMALQNEGLLLFEEYKRIKKDFEERNKYLQIIKITSPRAFGETWAENHILEVVPQFESSRSNKKLKAQGRYDVFYRKEPDSLEDIIRIEVKAGRAIDRTMHNLPYDKRALTGDEKERKFDMNFQQMKPDCFDIAILMGVWSDKIRYWVLSSEEMRSHKHFSSGQHRGNKGYEGQVHIKTENISDFDEYKVQEEDLFDVVLKKSVGS